MGISEGTINLHLPKLLTTLSPMWMATPGLEQAGVLDRGNLPLGNTSSAFRHLGPSGQMAGPHSKLLLVHLVAPFQVEEMQFGSITHCQVVLGHSKSPATMRDSFPGRKFY